MRSGVSRYKMGAPFPAKVLHQFQPECVAIACKRSTRARLWDGQSEGRRAHAAEVTRRQLRWNFSALLTNLFESVSISEYDIPVAGCHMREPELSPRERDVAALVARGQLNKQIAFSLGLSEGTIKEYLFRIFKKVGVDNRTGLAVWWLRRGAEANKQ
jgi:DNA-binding NarL/FixJ family response regulator